MYKSMKECEAMLDDIEESGKILNDWEAGFVDSARKQVDEGKKLTPPQREVLDEIHSR
mgnify:CR=1 FL=1